jgi:SAM-dependent methyltransferase
MGLIGGWLGYRLLRVIAPRPASFQASGNGSRKDYEGVSKLEKLFGKQVWDLLSDRTVVDFGCGKGEDVVEIAQHGARFVTGLDIREDLLEAGRRRAQKAGVRSLTQFTQEIRAPVDVVISLDSFEHFHDPEAALTRMYALLKPGGRALISFGPTWYHPHGGHSFSVFPWAHLLFTERALLRWRADFRQDGATRFSEIQGGLNQMTIRRFRQLVRKSLFCVESLTAVPIAALRFLGTRFTREWTTSYVKACLQRPAVDLWDHGPPTERMFGLPVANATTT